MHNPLEYDNDESYSHDYVILYGTVDTDKGKYPSVPNQITRPH